MAVLSAIVPDTKDWTWVLERPCQECGFDTRSVTGQALPELLLAATASWNDVLSAWPPGGAPLDERPRPDRWSALEYGCHVRDTFRIFDARLHLMLTTDDPLFDFWDQDALAVADRYAEHLPGAVASELVEAGATLAEHYAAVAADAWDRPGRRSDGANFTVLTLGRYLIHDPVHHLWDVGR